jgi:hypothetical protein
MTLQPVIVAGSSGKRRGRGAEALQEKLCC